MRKLLRGLSTLFFFIRVFLFYRYVIKFRSFVGRAKWLQKGHNSFLIVGDMVVAKFFIGIDTGLLNEYYNYHKVYNRFPSLRIYFSTPHLLRTSSLNILITAKLEQILEAEKTKFAKILYAKFIETGTTRLGVKTAEFEHIVRGLCVVENLYGTVTANEIQDLINDFLGKTLVSVGVRHGDFHGGNIFKDRTGQPRLIDLDSIRENSVQSLDPVYFCIESLTDSIKGEWYDVINMMNIKPEFEQQVALLLKDFDMIYHPEELLLFALDRVGFETSIGIIYSRNQLDTVITYYNKHNYDRKNYS